MINKNSKDKAGRKAAGIAKIFLSMAAALDKTYTDEFTRHTSSTSYDKIYIGRANVSSDEALNRLM